MCTSMPAADMWNFQNLLNGKKLCVLQCRLPTCVILRNPIVVNVLHRILAHEIDIKAESHNGSVYIKRRHVDLGNFKYAFLYCSLARLAREYTSEVYGLFVLVGKRYSALQINAPFTDGMLWKKGDVIECFLAESLLTGAAIDPVLKPDRHALQQSFRDFDEAMHDVYRICFQSWNGFPTASQIVNPADFSAMLLLGHRIQTTKVPDEWYAAFDALDRSAKIPLRVERIDKNLTLQHAISF